MNKKKVYFVVFISIVVFVSLVSIRLKQRNDEKEALKQKKPPVTAVSVTFPKRGNIFESFSTTGVLVSKNKVQITPKISGKLISLNVEEGDNVSKGQIIGEIDHSELDAQIIQAEAQFKVAKSSLDLLIAGPEDLQVVQAEAGKNQVEENMAQIKINLSQAEENYIRDEQLLKQGVITKDKLDSTRVQRDALRKQFNAINQQLIASKASLKLLKQGSRKEEISRVRAQVEQAQAGIKVLKAQLSNYNIISPLNGVVTNKNVDIGSLVGPNSPVVTISQSKNLELEMNIPEKQILNVKVGQRVNVKTQVKDINANIIKISPVVDNQTNLIKVTASINSDLPLRIGMSFDCNIIINEKNNSLIVPSESIMQEAHEKLIYVSVNNKVEAKKVVVGIQTPNEVEIKSGLNDKDQVIYKGNTFVKPGDKIQIEKDLAI